MSQTNPSPSDQPPTYSPIPADQSCKERATLANTANIDRTSMKAFLNNDPHKSARMLQPRDLATKILEQAHGDSMLVAKHLAFETQALKNIATVIPRIPPLSAYFFKDVEFAATMQVARQHIMPTSSAATLST